MKVGSTLSDPAGRRLTRSPALLVFLLSCILFSSLSYAQGTPEADATSADATVAETSSPAVVEAANETSTDSDVSEPVVTQTPEEKAAARLADTLKKNKRCLNCHKRERTKLLEDGTELPLQIHREDYLASAHSEVKCTSCHRAIGKRKHPSKKENISISSARDYSIEMNKGCKMCHRDQFKLYNKSVHAALVTQGSDDAPVCTSCHSAHAVETMDEYQAETGFPCKSCHENIYVSYSESVHGRARIEGNTIRDTNIKSPICADCHEAHQVTALAIGDILRTTCIECHGDVTLAHNKWLPNAGTHLDIVSCAVCHAPFARQKFDLHLHDNTANAPVAQEGDQSLQEQLQAIVAEDADLDPLETWKARGGFSQSGEPADISLRSRMEVMSGVAAHQIANKSFAVRTCDSCHESNSRQSKRVTVSITQPDGRKQSFETDRDILSSVGEINTISDFYALGGNPNKFLDYLLLLSFFGAVAGVAGHYAMGKVIAKEKKKEITDANA